MIKVERLSPLLFLLLILRLCANIIVLILALCFTPITTMLGIPWVGYTWESAYIYIWPMVFFSAATSLFDILSFINKKARETLFWSSLLLTPFIVMAWWFPFLLRFWPGGDDGEGFAWILILGSACAIASVFSVIGARHMLKSASFERLNQGWPRSSREKLIIAWCTNIAAGIMVLLVILWWYSIMY